MVVEVTRRETAVAGAIQALHLLRTIHRNTLRGGTAEATVQQASVAGFLEAMAPAAERALAHPQQLRRFQLAEFVRVIPVEHAPELDHSHTL